MKPRSLLRLGASLLKDLQEEDSEEISVEDCNNYVSDVEALKDDLAEEGEDWIEELGEIEHIDEDQEDDELDQEIKETIDMLKRDLKKILRELGVDRSNPSDFEHHKKHRNDLKIDQSSYHLTHNSVSKGDTTVLAKSFSNQGDVHVGDKIHQEIQDNSVSYDLNIADVSNIEDLSIYLTNKVGDTKVGIIGVIELLAGFLSIFSSLNSIFPGVVIINWFPLPVFSRTLGFTLLTIGIILVLLGSIFLNALKYKQDTKCKKCGKDYAYKPWKNPSVREVETREGTRQNIIDFLECRYCYDKIERKHHRLIPYEERDNFKKTPHF